MRLPNNVRIRDYVLIRTTSDTKTSSGDTVRATRSHLVHQMNNGAFLVAEKGKPGNPTSTRRFATGFVPAAPGGPNVILSFDEHERMYENAVDGTTRDSHPSAIAQLVMMKTGRIDPALAETVYCIASAIDQVIEALAARDPLIEFIMHHEVNGCYPSGEIRFLFTGREWTHPKIAEWLNRLERMDHRRREILASTRINPETSRYGTHAIGCKKFTPTAAAKLRQLPGWQPEFEDFVCTCGHRKKTDEFERPTIP